MPRKPLFRTKKLPYHVWARSNNKEWFNLPIEDVWKTFCWRLKEAQEKYFFEIHNFVLMSNHFHLIISTPEGNLDKIMHWLLTECSKEINYKSQRINHVFGGPYKWSVIAHAHYYKHVYRYLCQNPTRALICERVEDYAYSTLHYQFNKKLLPFKLSISLFEKRTLLSYPLHSQIEWLNIPYYPDEYECLRKAIRRRVFKITPNRAHKLPEIFAKVSHTFARS
jgi:putative transposase